MNQKEKIAKVIRIISVPPVMVTTLLLILAGQRGTIFHNVWELIITLFLLGVVPVLAYPLQKVIPSLGDSVREGQRELAFLLNFVSYTAVFLWAVLAEVSWSLGLICMTYFLSVVLLLVCNKILHFRASGHACSVTGPILLLIRFIGWETIIPCVAFGALVVWSSLYLKRHTKKELAAGVMACVIAFAISALTFHV